MNQGAYEEVLRGLLLAAASPDNLDAFLRRTIEILGRQDALGPNASLAIVLHPGTHTPPLTVAVNFTKEEQQRFAELSLAGAKPAKDLLRAAIKGGGAKGCLLARIPEPEYRARAGHLIETAAKTIIGRLAQESREKQLTRERDIADATTHIEEFFLASPGITLEEISRTVLDEARRLTGSSFGFAGYICPDTGWLRIQALTRETWESAPESGKDVVFKEFAGLWGWVLKHKKPVLTNAAASDPRAGGTPGGHVKIERFAAAPAVSGKKLLGILSLANPPGDWPASTLEAITKLARVYALMLQHKLAEQQKQADDAKHKSILDSSTDLIFNLSTDGKLNFVSRAIEAYGYAPEDVLGRHFAGFVHPADRDYVVNAFSASLKAGRSLSMLSYKLRRKDGTFAVVEQKAAITPRPGATTIVAGVIRDITGKRQAEAQLAESETRYRTLFNEANAAIVLADVATGLILDVNSDAEKLFGRTREELIGMHQQELHPPEAADDVRRKFRKYTDKGSVTLLEITIVRKDGSRAQVLLSASNLTLNGKEVVQGIFQDVSTQRRAERLLQDIVEENPMSIQIIDKDGYSLKTNQEHTRIFGAQPPPDYSIFKDPQLKRTGFPELFKRIRKGEVVHVPDTPYNAHDSNPAAPDKPIWLRAVIFPLFDGAGHPKRFVIMHEDITARKLAEDKLNEATLLNKSIIDNSREGIIVYDLDLRYRLFNPFMEKLTGLKAKDVIGRHPSEVFPFLEGAGVMHRLKKILRGEKPEALDLRFSVKKTGREGWATDISYPLRDAAGKVTGVVAIVRDITTRRKIEEKYQALVESTDTGYLILNSKGQVVDFNKEYLRLTGRRDIKEILGHRVTEWTAPYDKERNAREVAKCLKKGFVRNLCVDYVDKRAKVIPVEINATVVKTGDSFQIVSLCRDISERKLAEARLRESEERYRLMFDSAPDPVIIHDKRGRVLAVNKAASAAYGYTQAEFLRLNVSDLDTVEKAKQIKERVTRLFEEEHHMRFETRHRRKDGSVITVDVNASSGFLDGEKAMFSTCRDITGRKAAEMALRESEEKHRIFFENSPDAIFVHSFDGKVFFVNNATVRMYGYSREEFLRMNVAELSVPAKRSRYKTRSEHVDKDGETTFEITQRLKSGATLPVEVHARKGLWRGVPAVFSLCRDISARKAAEAAQLENAALLKAQQETSPEAILVVDNDGKIRSFNRHFSRMWKLPATVMASKSDELALNAVIRQLAAPEAFLKRVRYLYKHPAEESHDELATKDGRIIERFSSAALGEDGKYYGRTWYFRDITESKRAADLLAASERKYRTLTESSFDLIYLIGRDDTVQYVNQAALNHLHKKAADVIGRPRAALFPPRVAARQKQALDRVFATGKPLFAEDEARLGESVNYQETNLIPIKDPLSGGVEAVLGVSRDVTERKQLENILKESEEKMRTIFETASDQIFIKGLDGRFQSANKACADFFGLTPDAMRGKANSDLFPPEAAREVEADDQEVLRTGNTSTKTYERTNDSGRYFHHVVKTPLRNADGMVTGMMGVVRDVTLLKKMESELALARAVEAVSREARPMAHDFNNALAAINGYATMIEDELADTNPMKQEIAQIIKAVKRAAELTSKFQDFARNPRLDGRDQDAKKDPA